VITKDQLQYIIDHAQSTYPEECCGFLIGISAEEKWVRRAVSVPNTHHQSRSNRYIIDPVEIVRADEAAQRANLDLLGVYHSHPDAPPQPSQIDREYAWPRYTYVIVSIENRVRVSGLYYNTVQVFTCIKESSGLSFLHENMMVVENFFFV
jgi:proteasome lid subunit RPN8/RPN11